MTSFPTLFHNRKVITICALKCLRILMASGVEIWGTEHSMNDWCFLASIVEYGFLFEGFVGFVWIEMKWVIMS